MNGNFETGASAYPVGYLKSGMLYQVVFMPTLEPLDRRAVRQSDAVQIACAVNAQHRAGAYKVGDATHLEAVQLAVTEAIDAIGPGNIPEDAVA